MANLASPTSFEKQQAAARAQIFQSWPGRVPSRLPIRLAELSPDIRDLVGKAVNAGTVRLLLDDDGAPIVAWRRP
jgi:hypothetical protein